MYGVLTALQKLIGGPSPDPSVAAAVTVLCTRPPPIAVAALDRALQAVAPLLSAVERSAWTATLAERLTKTGISTPRCVAAFLGQCAVESAGFRCLEEDLNYSATRLCEVWPSEFPDTAAAEACAMQPETLANRVYANRLGNGDEASGDGWQFRGRGLIQITGRSAYQRFAAAVGMTLDQAVAHAAAPAGAVDSAIWFWTVNQLNSLATTWSIERLSLKINGSLTGEAERSRLCAAALHVLGS